ncbi:MAG: multicopper oxidase family protein [Pseudomonadota bacterium]
MPALSRRRLLVSAAALGAAAPFAPAGFAATPVEPARALRIERRSLAVNGRSASVFGIRQPDGRHGLVLGSRDRFRVELANALSEPTIVHWHGQEPPSSQDGVPNLSMLPLPPGTVQVFDYAPRPGTHWMHSHLTLQEQELLAAPLIVRTSEDERADVQEVIVILHDFSFKSPDEILRTLGAMTASGAPAHGQAEAMPGGHSMPGMQMGGMQMGGGQAQAMPGMQMGGMAMPGGSAPAAADVNEVDYDAYLANDRTLDDPELVRVENGARVRLRIINAGAGTNFFLDLGALKGRVLAVDGNATAPIEGSLFPIAIAQRLDVALELARGEGAFPVLFQREAEVQRTGVILATRRGQVARISGTAAAKAGLVGDSDFETRLAAAEPLAARAADRQVTVALTGSMAPYVWGLGADPATGLDYIAVRKGERVSMVLRNDTGMAHPMHLHGHHFQVLAVGDRKIAGAVRDTVLVPAKGSVAIAFDATNPGRWAFHCHLLYHMAAGMITELRYLA